MKIAKKKIIAGVSSIALATTTILGSVVPAQANSVRSVPFTPCMDMTSPDCVVILHRANIFRPQQHCDQMKPKYQRVRVVRIAFVPFCAIPAIDAPNAQKYMS